MIDKKIEADLKEALKNKDNQRLSVLRMMAAALHNEAINLKKKDQGLNDQEQLAVLKREVKKRKDSVSAYQAGGRGELAQKEQAEINIIEQYLPASLSETEIRKIVEDVIATMGEVNESQFGLVMKNVMTKLAGQADGSVVSQAVKDVLKK